MSRRTPSRALVRCLRRACLAAGVLLAGPGLFSSSAAAQAPPASEAPLTRDTPLAAADLRADLALLREAYTTLHPGLYRYATPAEVAARFDAVDRHFATDRTLAEAFLALTRLTAAIRCGHSYPNFWNQRRAVQAALFEGRDRLPFEFRWLGRTMVVTAGHVPDDALPRGTEIVAIDGVPAGTILDSLLPLARADGGNDAKRRSYLEVVGRSRYHAFDVLYPLVFRVRDTLVTLRVRRPGSRALVTVRAAYLTAAERRGAGDDETPAAPGAPLWQYEERGGVGILTMPTWALFNTTWDARAWTESLLAGLAARGVPDLVLDIRGNEGGLDAGNALLAHVVTAPVTLPRYDRFVRYRSVPEALRPHLDTWDRSFDDWGDAAVPMGDGRFRLVRYDDEGGGDVVAPAAPHYGGRLWVLVDAANSSATFQFALAVKQSGLGTLVGEPTGGNRRGINGGAFYFLRLPRTGLEVDLPLIAGVPEAPQPDAGVEPDVLVRPTAADIAAGRDVVLEAVLARAGTR